MVSYSEAEYLRCLAKQQKLAPAHEGTDNESKLQREILAYCDAQWPKWIVLYPRMDKKSTLPVGAHDLTIFKPNAVLCVECKTRTGKRTLEQSAWAMQMMTLGHVVHIVRSMEEFLAIAK